MLRLTRGKLALLLAFPVAAVADPVAITTHSSGTVYANPLILHSLGMDNVPDQDMSYDLTVRSFVDPSAAGFTDYGYWFAARNSDIEFTLMLGSLSYHYSGKGMTSLMVREFDQLDYAISFDAPESMGYDFVLTNTVIGPAGTFSDRSPFASRNLEPGGNLTADTQFASYPQNPDAPRFWTEYADVKMFSLQVSPVPEPASFGMLAAGVLALALWRRRSPAKFAC